MRHLIQPEFLSKAAPAGQPGVADKVFLGKLNMKVRIVLAPSIIVIFLAIYHINKLL